MKELKKLSDHTRLKIIEAAQYTIDNYHPELTIEQVIAEGYIHSVNSVDGEVGVAGISTSNGKARCRITGKIIKKGEKRIDLWYCWDTRCSSGYTATKCYIKLQP